MDDREQQRKIRHRLAVLRHAEEVTGSVAATCRYYGITRQCFYKWRRRYEDEGEAGLRDRSSAPLRHPNETPTEIVGKILYLRQALPLRAVEDLHLLEALPRHRDRPLGRVPGP